MVLICFAAILGLGLVCDCLGCVTLLLHMPTDYVGLMVFDLFDSFDVVDTWVGLGL